MFILDFKTPNYKYSNNRVNRRSHPLLLLPFITLTNYFFWNYENLYFVIVSLFQISTSEYLSIFPSHYCPTGPWATAIPLLLCVFIEMVKDIYNWFLQYYNDSQENQKPILVYEKNKWNYLNNASIRPGNIIYIRKNEVIPIDGILIGEHNNFNGDASNKSEIKISLSPLNGESSLVPIELPIASSKLEIYNKSKLSVLDFGGKLLNQFSGYIYLESSKKIKLNGNHFIPAGSILKSDGACIWVITCGGQKNVFHIVRYIR